jgi:hypothetical protein
MKWLLRMAAILTGVGLLDVLVVLAAPRPLPWAAIIPGLIPVLTAVFVIRPMQRDRSS